MRDAADHPSDAALQAKWSPAPDWSSAAITRENWSARPVAGLRQVLVSGDLPRAVAAVLPGAEEVGLWEQARRQEVLVRIALDRALIVGEGGPALEHGWHAEGFASTAADDLYRIFELRGEGVRDLLREGTAADLDGGSRSAALNFAGVPALLYRTGDNATRLQVENPLAAYLWQWLVSRPS